MARQRKGAKSTLEYGLVRALKGAFRTMSLERAVKVGGAIGGVAMSLDKNNRHVAERNLEIAFPDLGRGARMAILRGAYRNWGRMFAEFANFDRLTTANIKSYVIYDGLENF